MRLSRHLPTTLAVFIFIFIFLALTFFGCGGSSSNKDNNNPQPGANNPGGSPPSGTGSTTGSGRSTTGGTTTGGSTGSSTGSGSSGTGTTGGTTGGSTGGSTGGGTGSSQSQASFIFGASGSFILDGKIDANGQITTISHQDQQTGHAGFPTQTGGPVRSIAADPKGRFVYTVDLSSSFVGVHAGKPGISEYVLDRNTGELNPVDGEEVPIKLRSNRAEDSRTSLTTPPPPILTAFGFTPSIRAVEPSVSLAARHLAKLPASCWQ
jgi:hypothetical protein